MFSEILALSGAAIGVIVAVAAVVVIAIIIAAVYISLKNGLIRVVNRTEESWATIDVYLKKRYDLIPNLVATVKGYAKHESEVLEKVIAARNTITGAKTQDERIAAENELGKELKTFMNFTVERYPELKANSSFMDLSSKLSGIESDLANARKYYNANVREYNNKIMVFPTAFIARGMKLEKKSYFELDSEAERVAPKVEF